MTSSPSRKGLALAGATALTAAALVVPVQAAHAIDPVCSTLTYTTFDDPMPAPLTLNGSAAVAGVAGSKVLRVTPSQFSQAGTAFTSSKVSFLNDGSFSTFFTFSFTAQQGGGADGLVFTVQNVSNSVGGLGGGIGYMGIDQSIGVEFDNWFNGGYDIDGNHVGIDVNGDITSNPTITSPVALDNSGALHRAWVDYNGVTDQLEVRLADSDTRPLSALLTKTLNLPDILGGAGPDATDAFVGFTSGTGSAAAHHDVHSWQLINCYQPIDAPPTVTAGGPYSGAEGSAVTLAGTATDDGTVTSQWSYVADSADAGATCTFADATDPTTTVTCTDDGTYTLTLTGDDGVSAPVASNATLTVSNVAPEVASVSTTFTAACTVSASASFSDAGTNDTHTATLDWGDGASGGATVSETAGAGTATGSHTYAAAGSYTVTATVTDDEGAADSGSASVTTKNTASAFGAPIDAGGARSVFKLGSTIPLKITVTDCSGNLVQTLSPMVQLDKIDSTPAGPVNEAEITEVPTNGKLMAWNGEHYHYNLSTKRSEFFGGAALTIGTYRITVNDPTLFAPATVFIDLR
ncbi:PKD domain-containing protein [Knoellia locipacati]|uniref:L-type lectin-domain containing protein n=1 Tax=Knoellia locipacati TaxID=882824 RepID=UPI0038514CB7